MPILYVISRRNTFTRIDRDALRSATRSSITYQEGFRPAPGRAMAKVGDCDAIVGWFASWHTALALRFARMRRKPSLLIFGGFDTAAMPEIGYGSQRGGVRRRLVARRPTWRRAWSRTPSSSLDEIAENVGDRPARGSRSSITASRTASPNVDRRRPRERDGADRRRRLRRQPARKGHGPFCEAAASWRMSSSCWPGRGGTAPASGSPPKPPPNLRVTGRLSDDDLDALFAAPPCTSRPRCTRASACRSPRRCWRARCRS